MENVWKVNDSIQCQQLTPEYLEECLNLLDSSFYTYENVSQAINLSSDSAAIKELQDLIVATAKDGVSVVAIDKTTNKVAGVAFNKIQVKNDAAFEKFVDFWKEPRSKYLVQFMADFDNLCNLFEYCQVDCILELTFLGTSPEYRRKGVAKRLSEATIDIGKSLLKGINVKKSLDGTELPLEPAPKIVSAIFSSFITQKIGKRLEFTVAAEKRYEEFEYEGKNFASIVGKETPTITLEYKRLD